MAESMSRRALFAGAVGALLGVAARALPAAAAEGDPLLLGKTNVMGDNPTIIRRDTEFGSAPALSIPRDGGTVDLGGSTAIVAKKGTRSGAAIDATGDTLLHGNLRVDETAEVKRVRLVAFFAIHPEHGTRGDLIVDRNSRLWFCRGRKDWVRIA